MEETGSETPEGASGRPHGMAERELAAELAAAEAIILARPRLSIQLRLLASLVLCFVLCASFAVSSLVMLERLRTSQQGLMALREIALHAREAVRPGAGHDLEGARHHLDAALEQVTAALAAGHRDLDRDALLQLQRALRAERDAGAMDAGAVGRSAPGIEALLQQLLQRQREAVARHERVAEYAPFALLVVLLLLFVLIAAYFGRALQGPIRRFQRYTRHIAAGDFSLVRPARTYRDEFSDLALAVNRMLTELRAHQEQYLREAKLAAVGRITSGIAHELNNPLNNITITVEALLEDMERLEPDERWRLLQDVYFETERAAEIVHSLLDFARSEPIATVPVDLEEVIRSTLKLAHNEMTAGGVAAVLELAPDLPRCRGTPNQLRQVFLNLLLNAVHAMPEGGTVHLRTMSAPGSGTVCAEVADSGDGIPADILPHIFEPFFTTKEPGRGTGLGLSVCHSIVTKLGGHIEARSEPGEGAVFHVCLLSAEELEGAALRR